MGIFREVGAPKRLTTLVEGESLFNDAASIALYSVLLAVLGGHGELTASGIFNDFIVHFIGGGIAGFAMGRLACFLFAWLRGFPTAEITLTLTLAYLSFFISEHYLNVSGVVATVIAGPVVGRPVAPACRRRPSNTCRARGNNSASGPIPSSSCSLPC